MSNVRAPLAPLLGDIKICVHGFFCRKFNFEQLLIFRRSPYTLLEGSMLRYNFKSQFAILGSTMNTNVTAQEGEHECCHYLLIYAIKPNFKKCLSNTDKFNSYSTSYCCYFISEIRKQTVYHRASVNFL